MLAAIGTSGITALFDRLAQRYSLVAGELTWQETTEPEGYNNSLHAAYQHSAVGTGGSPAMTAHLWFTLSPGYASGLRSVVDLRINFGAIDPTSMTSEPAEVPAELRVQLRDLIDFFTHGWEIATTVLPLMATTEPLDGRPAGAPRLELYISNERPELSGKPRTVRTLDMVDLSAFGRSRRTQLGDLSVGVTTPLGLDRASITKLVKEAMIRMAEDFAFTEVDAAEL
jgi:hypothetical protein